MGQQFEGEAAKDYQGGHGWDECQGGVHAKRVTIMPKEFQQKKKKMVWLKMMLHRHHHHRQHHHRRCGPSSDCCKQHWDG